MKNLCANFHLKNLKGLIKVYYLLYFGANLQSIGGNISYSNWPHFFVTSDSYN